MRICIVCTVERQPIRVTTPHQRLREYDRSKMNVLERARSQYLRDQGQCGQGQQIVAFVKGIRNRRLWKHGSALLMRIEAEILHRSSNGPLRSARVDSNPSNANSRNNETTSAHLSSPSNLLLGACPIKFFCLSAYSRAIIEQWTS